MLKVAIFDDVVAARGETFHIPGLEVHVHPHADDAARLCRASAYDVVFMDFAMGPGRRTGSGATGDLRADGFRGRIIGISSDPAANAAMRAAGADDALDKKAHLRSYLVNMGARHLRGAGPAPASRGTGQHAAIVAAGVGGVSGGGSGSGGGSSGPPRGG
jgi:CheY-like chemotaxis protein